MRSFWTSLTCWLGRPLVREVDESEITVTRRHRLLALAIGAAMGAGVGVYRQFASPEVNGSVGWALFAGAVLGAVGVGLGGSVGYWLSSREDEAARAMGFTLGNLAGLVMVLNRFQSATHGNHRFPAELGIATLTGLLAGVGVGAMMRSLLTRRRRNV